MSKNEKSPFEGKKMSIKKLGEVMRHLLKYNRIIWLEMCKGSEVILREAHGIEHVVLGPHPNWKAYKILCHILVYEQEKAKGVEEAKAVIKNRPLFITPAPLVFVPPGS